MRNRPPRFDSTVIISSRPVHSETCNYSSSAGGRELRRNAELRQMCGFDVPAGADAVPTDSAFSRFMALLMEHKEEIENIFHKLVDELKKRLPDLGKKLTVDSKAIRSYGRPVKDEKKKEDRRRDTDWGVKTYNKTYKGKREDGTMWKKTARR